MERQCMTAFESAALKACGIISQMVLSFCFLLRLLGDNQRMTGTHPSKEAFSFTFSEIALSSHCEVPHSYPANEITSEWKYWMGKVQYRAEPSWNYFLQLYKHQAYLGVLCLQLSNLIYF